MSLSAQVYPTKQNRVDAKKSLNTDEFQSPRRFYLIRSAFLTTRKKESDRLGLGIRFLALAPRIMPDSEIGKHAVAGYSRYLGISKAEFVQGMESPPTASDVATAAIELVTEPDPSKGNVFVVWGKGLEAVP
jgi:hypothetical protein